MSLFRALKIQYNRELFQPDVLGIVVNPFYLIRRDLYIAIKDLSPFITGKVLDIGCGSKPYENLFVLAKEYIGCDIEVSGHDHSKSKIDKFYDGKTLPFPDNSFDSIVSFETFEHIFNLREILKEAHRVAKPEARLLISVPFAWDEHEAPYDFARYTSFGIKFLLEDAGFEVLELKKTAGYVRTISQLWIAYLAQHVSPKSRFWQRIFQVSVLFPMTSLAILFHYLLPKRNELFCNSVVLARKAQAN